VFTKILKHMYGKVLDYNFNNMLIDIVFFFSYLTKLHYYMTHTLNIHDIHVSIEMTLKYILV